MNFNTYWYLGLVVLSTILFIYICKRKGTLPTSLFLLVIVELAFLIETVIYVYGVCYDYHPDVVKNNAFYDSTVGALASSLFTVPVLATFIGSFQLKWPFIAFATAMLAIVEWVFVKLGIYTLYWWKIEYTSFGLFFVFFPLARVLYRKLMQPLNGLWHSLFLFLCSASVLAMLLGVPVIFLSNRYYKIGLFGDPARETIGFIAIYYLLITLFINLLVKHLNNYKAFRYVLLAVVLLILDIILKRAEILYSVVWWDQFYYIIAPLLALRISEAESKLLSKGLGNWIKP